jgi:hypothetical protein
MAFILSAATANFEVAAQPAGTASSGSPDDEMAFLDGLSLVVLDTEDILSLQLARRMIRSYGGTVAIMSPPSILIGWVPPNAREALIGNAGIREIYMREVLTSELPSGAVRANPAVGFFNRAVRGDIAREHRDYTHSLSSGAPRPPRQPDVRTAEPLDEAAYLENLRLVGLDIDGLADEGKLVDRSSPAATGNSDYMTGTVALTIFFVESNGSGSDPDVYTWTPDAMDHYLEGVYSGLAWWANRTVMHGDCWVSFLVNYYSGSDTRCQQWVEPILHGTEMEDTWVKAIMTNFGYTSGSRFSRVTAFNTWQRSYYQSDRSYSAFVPFNPVPAPTQFADGHTAYAYWYGPYTVLLFRVSGWTTAQVFAHESGHVFGACDEYGGGCDALGCTSTCANGAINGNCEVCNAESRDCMMKANSYSLCAYTPTHVGWEVQNPCAPPEPPLLPAPSIVSVSPPYSYQALEAAITVTGANFYPGVKLVIGSDVFVHTTTLVNSTTINAVVESLRDAPPGPRDVRVENRDDQFATLPQAFDVRATTRHYYSPAGGNHFPYVTPADAATALSDAVDAAFDGDSIFVSTGTFDNFSIIIQRGVLLYGGWNDAFTVRNPATGKTVLNLSGNVTFVTTGGAAGLDGFLLANGTGASDVLPFNAVFGGAVRFIGGTAILASCEIHSCSAGGESDFGVGGAVYADGATVNFHDNEIHGNSATQGGALYLRACTGTIANNLISENSLNASLQPRFGGGIAVLNSSNVTLAGNVITGNTNAADGGGLYFADTPAVTISDGAVRSNSTSFSGGGAVFKQSAALIDGVEFAGNTAWAIGGAIYSTDNSELTVTGCSFRSNSAMIGGGIYAATGEFLALHTLFVLNNGSSSGGALLISGVSAGGVIGNTLDRNSSGSGAGVSIGSSPVPVFNNIVANSTGTAFTSTGTPPNMGCNLAWTNSGGDYSGCNPGNGSLSGDPQFVAPLSYDYHLGLHSPAIDAGTLDPGYEDPDGSRGDMGIYGSHAFSMDQPSYPKNLVASLDGASVRLDWDRNPEGDVASYVVYAGTASDFIPSAAAFVTFAAGADSTAIVDLPADSIYFRISAVDTSGYAGGYSTAAFFSPATGIGGESSLFEFALQQNVPNPFNPATRISYELPVRAHVTLAVYDVNGRLVRRLVDSVDGPGARSAKWEGRDDSGQPAASGVYFYRLRAANRAETKKMILLK